MTDYAAGGAALRDSTYLTRPERWFALKRFDLIVAQDLARGTKKSAEGLAARAAFEAPICLVTVVSPVLMVLFIMALLLGPKTDNYLPLQVGTMVVAVALFTSCYLRGRAARRHFLRTL